MTLITKREPDHPLLRLVTGDRSDKDRDNLIRRFIEWQSRNAIAWYEPRLSEYRDYLINDRGLKPATIRVYLTTIRTAYSDILRDNQVRQRLLESTPDGLAAADRFAMLNEAITRLQNAIHPKAVKVRVTTSQDVPDARHIRLTPEQAMALLQKPGLTTAKGLRDTAIIALMLCTGIREQELSSLNVEDLRQQLGGELALHVREGKGAKERLIPYGDLSWCLVLVDAWLQQSGINDGAVFRGLNKAHDISTDRLSVRGIQKMLAGYPVVVDGRERAVKPHDLRRTYARMQFDAGMQLIGIQQNLGHADLKTTQGYIGVLSVEKRRAKAALSFDLSGLERWTG